MRLPALMIIALAVFVSTVKAMPDSATIADDSLYVVLYTLGPNWDTTKQTHEQTGFRAHSSRLRDLRAAKILVMGARYSDTGMIVIKAKHGELADTC